MTRPVLILVACVACFLAGWALSERRARAEIPDVAPYAERADSALAVADARLAFADSLSEKARRDSLSFVHQLAERDRAQRALRSVLANHRSATGADRSGSSGAVSNSRGGSSAHGQEAEGGPPRSGGDVSHSPIPCADVITACARAVAADSVVIAGLRRRAELRRQEAEARKAEALALRTALGETRKGMDALIEAWPQPKRFDVGGSAGVLLSPLGIGVTAGPYVRLGAVSLSAGVAVYPATPNGPVGFWRVSAFYSRSLLR